MTLERILELIAAEKFYLCREWKHKRKDILKRDNFECQKCKRKYHRYRKATTVHHLKHLKDFPELAFDDDNLEALCTECHNEEHPEKFKDFYRFVNKKRWDDERW